jgi:hypothetical protein
MAEAEGGGHSRMTTTTTMNDDIDDDSKNKIKHNNQTVHGRVRGAMVVAMDDG